MVFKSGVPRGATYGGRDFEKMRHLNMCLGFPFACDFEVCRDLSVVLPLAGQNSEKNTALFEIGMFPSD